jgi:hypothetical protein
LDYASIWTIFNNIYYLQFYNVLIYADLQLSIAQKKKKIGYAVFLFLGGYAELRRGQKKTASGTRCKVHSLRLEPYCDLLGAKVGNYFLISKFLRKPIQAGCA